MGLVSSTLGGCAGSCNACSSRSGTSAWWTGGCTSIASQVVDWTWHCSSAVRSKASKANRTAGENATPPRSNGLNFTAMSLEKTTNADSQTHLARFGQRNSYVPMLPGTVRPFGSCAAQEKPRACPGGGASFSIGKCAGLHPAGLLYRKSPRLSPRLSGTQRPGGWVRLEEEPALVGTGAGQFIPSNECREVPGNRDRSARRGWCHCGLIRHRAIERQGAAHKKSPAPVLGERGELSSMMPGKQPRLVCHTANSGQCHGGSRARATWPQGARVKESPRGSGYPGASFML
jgi:hypothetical protein